MHVAYLGLVVVLPLAGAGLIAAGVLARRRSRCPSRRRVPLLVPLVGAIACLLAPVGAYASFVEPYRLQLETATVSLPAEHAGPAPIRVGVLADIQTARVTRYEHDAVDRLMALQPEVILLPGDLMQAPPGTESEVLGGFRELMGKLAAPGGVYFVLGDVDSPEQLRAIFAGTRVHLLVNDVVRTTIHGRAVTIGGTELSPRSVGAVRTVQRLGRSPEQGDVRILLAHRPDAALNVTPEDRIDLVVAGHTHGGQFVIPGLGPPITLTGVPRLVAAGGLHRLDSGQRIYVSRGVGMERDQAPPLRFFCPPEVTLLELE
jgi:predicted MPP superfamily phosphohydrolase